MVNQSAGLGASNPISETDWGIHLVPRTGAPPLRFSGRRIFEDRLGASAPGIFVALWEMRRQGFVLVHTLPLETPLGQAATSVDSIDHAVETLEQFCDVLRSEIYDHELPQDLHLDGTLTALFAEQQRQGRVEDFLNLAGLALAKWDAWCAEMDMDAPA